MSGPSERVRVALSMTRADYDALKAEAASADMTVSALIRRAVIVRRYIDEKARAGATLLVEQDGIQREVVFQ